MAHEMAHGLARHMLKGALTGVSGQFAAGKVAQLHQMPEGEPETAASFMLTLPVWQQQDRDFVLSHIQGKVGAETQKNLEFALNDSFAQNAMGRDMEAEADKLGTRMLAAAGYDVYGLVRTFDRWNDRADGDTRYYSHPALGTRAGTIKNQIAKESLKGDDRGAERHAAIVKLLTPPAPAQGVVTVPALAAGVGCFHGEALQPVRKLKR
jgi:predicted Zn-dependent protease